MKKIFLLFAIVVFTNFVKAQSSLDTLKVRGLQQRVRDLMLLMSYEYNPKDTVSVDLWGPIITKINTAIQGVSGQNNKLNTVITIDSILAVHPIRWYNIFKSLEEWVLDENGRAGKNTLTAVPEIAFYIGLRNGISLSDYRRRIEVLKRMINIGN